jgi:arylsulfatase A-like enzyme
MNVLFITADQWRGECLSSLGHPHVKTPNLDILAADGVTFRRHFAQATPCGPSRACLYTGMYLQNHRSVLNGTPLDNRHTNVALEARKHGYEPALFGYTDVSLDPRKFGDGNIVPGGYEGVLPGMDPLHVLTGDWAPWLDELRAKGYHVPDDPNEIFKPEPVGEAFGGKGKTFNPARFKAEDSNSAHLTDKVMKYVTENQSAPWFAHLSFFSPHPPFLAPEPYNAMYDADEMPLPIRQDSPETEAGQHPWLAYYLYNQTGAGFSFGKKSKDNLTVSDVDLRQIKATYYGMMSEVDGQIGRLISHLKELGIYDKTLIIFTSDHGEHLGDHWMFAKYSHFDQTFHIPLILCDPSEKANKSRGTIVEAFSESVDVMPTILDSIDAEIPDQCDGRSLLPFCRGVEPLNWRQEYHAEFDLRSPYDFEQAFPLELKPNQCTVNIVSGNRYKYVHFAGLPPLFFDRLDDPNEFIDRMSDPLYSPLVAEYAGKMLSWRMEHDDTALTNLHLADDGTVLQRYSS